MSAGEVLTVGCSPLLNVGGGCHQVGHQGLSEQEQEEQANFGTGGLVLSHGYEFWFGVGFIFLSKIAFPSFSEANMMPIFQLFFTLCGTHLYP